MISKIKNIIQRHFFIETAVIGSLLVFLIGCESFDRNLASYKGEKLTEEEFELFLSSINQQVDSDSLREEYINNWLKQKIVNHKLKNINNKIYIQNKENAKKYLFNQNLFELENHYIRKELDTVVTKQQVMEHYQNNRENYLRKSFIVKALYLKIDDTLSVKDKLIEAFLLKNDNDREVINKYANIYSRSFYWSDDSWIFLDDLTREVPFGHEEKENLVIEKGEGIFKDEKYIYLLNVLDYKMKESKTPLTFEEKEIKQHVIKRRINTLREKVKKDLLKEIRDEKNN